MIEELVSRVWSHSALHSEAATLIQNHLRRALLNQTVALGTPDQVHRLARSAVILASAKEPEKKLLAYRIASALARVPTSNHPT